MLAHATKALYIYIYISSYMKIEIFDRKSEKDLIVFGKMNGGGDGSRYCLRAYVNAMCWSPLKGSQWKIGDFISTLHPSYYVYPILFFISFFLFSRIRIDGSFPRPIIHPLLFTSVIPATFYTTTTENYPQLSVALFF